MKNNIFVSLLFSMSLNASSVEVLQKPQMQIVARNILELLPASIVCARDLSDIKILHIEDAFFAFRDGKIAKVQNYNIDQELRGLSQDDVKNFLEDGYVTLTQSSNGDLNLKAQARLRGGGLLGGKIAYWATKTLCWAIVGGTAVAGTHVVVGAAAPVVGAKLGLSAATTAKLAVAGKAGANLAVGKIGVVGGGAKVVAAVIASDAALAVPATEAVVAYAGAAGGLTGLAASIEGLSIAVGGFFGFVTGPV